MCEPWTIRAPHRLRAPLNDGSGCCQQHTWLLRIAFRRCLSSSNSRLYVGGWMRAEPSSPYERLSVWGSQPLKNALRGGQVVCQTTGVHGEEEGSATVSPPHSS